MNLCTSGRRGWCLIRTCLLAEEIDVRRVIRVPVRSGEIIRALEAQAN
jgi:hypothetical protein